LPPHPPRGYQACSRRFEVKCHSALLGTGELAAKAIDAAIKATGMPATLSIRRWVRPVAYQNRPAALLPHDRDA